MNPLVVEQLGTTFWATANYLMLLLITKLLIKGQESDRSNLLYVEKLGEIVHFSHKCIAD